MTSQHEFPRNGPKAETRRRTLSIVQEHTRFWHNGHLTCDWMELCGKGDETLRMLLDADALQPGCGRYLGVNMEEAVLDHNRKEFVPQTEAGLVQWVLGDLCTLLSDLDAFPNTGIIVFDSFNSASKVNLDVILDTILGFAKSQQRKLGQALVVLNLALRGNMVHGREAGKRRLQEYLRERLGVEVSQEQFHDYRSKKVEMRMCWIGLGF